MQYRWKIAQDYSCEGLLLKNQCTHLHLFDMFTNIPYYSTILSKKIVNYDLFVLFIADFEEDMLVIKFLSEVDMASENDNFSKLDNRIIKFVVNP